MLLQDEELLEAVAGDLPCLADNAHWKGPGMYKVSGTAQKADASLFLKSCKRIKTRTVGGIISKEEFKKRKNNSTDKKKEPPTPQEATKMLMPYCNEWECRLDVVDEDFIAVKEFESARAIATKLICEMQEIMETLDLSLTGYFPIPMIRALYDRAVIRTILDDKEGAVADASECFKLIRANRKGKTVHELEIMLLYVRAKCLERLGDLRGAILDMRGCCAAIRMDKTRWDSGMFFIKQLVTVVTMEKLQKKGSSGRRPYYSSEERLQLEEELGLGAYGLDGTSFKCSQCDNKLCNNKDLKLCSCEAMWYCSKACKEDAFNNGHGESCSPFSGGSRLFVLGQDDLSCSVTQKQTNFAFVTVFRFQDVGPRVLVIMYDPEKDEHFDVLSDNQVLIMPKKQFHREQHKEKYCEKGQTVLLDISKV